MVGELVPVVMLPRFTSYVGQGSFPTVPLDVEAYEFATVTFWRGPLVGGAASNPFRVYFEESHDAQTWTSAFTTPTPPVTTANATGSFTVVFAKRWFRIRTELLADVNGVVGISLWMAGGLQRRVK
jgi:hypothetical protein